MYALTTARARASVSEVRSILLGKAAEKEPSPSWKLYARTVLEYDTEALLSADAVAVAVVSDERGNRRVQRLAPGIRQSAYIAA